MDNLKRQVANHKQEEEALLNEMEVTGQAFEDMQEQNARLIQQLREKVKTWNRYFRRFLDQPTRFFLLYAICSTGSMPVQVPGKPQQI